ncbi:hypothetical protein [Demequina aurantiaca]|uniref:hypothetical protein n=1 Tax=Demequina aurantiaca TaxID=676200 RepID=UPI003D34DF23
MPKYSGVTFSVQPVETDGSTAGYVISGFVTQNQLDTLRDFMDGDGYETARRWRGEYQELAKALTHAIKGAAS